jgi:hypothetical protein
MIRIAKAATKLFDRKTCPAVQIDESIAEAWANSIIAYVLAFSSVLAALTALANGRAASGRLENVAALAHWSKSYTVQAYHFTKALGLLSGVQPSAAIGFSDEEDIALAEVGLDSYAEALRQNDQP